MLADSLLPLLQDALASVAAPEPDQAALPSRGKHHRCCANFGNGLESGHVNRFEGLPRQDGSPCAEQNYCTNRSYRYSEGLASDTCTNQLAVLVLCSKAEMEQSALQIWLNSIKSQAQHAAVHRYCKSRVRMPEPPRP